MVRRLPLPPERRQIRERAGVSQAVLANSLGVTDAAVSRWEGGERRPRGQLLERYVEALAIMQRATEDG
jgi:DNA-binding transcriptional regulator YiaG